MPIISKHACISERSKLYVPKEYTYELADKLIIKLAPTGMIPTKNDTPYVPTTPNEIIRDTYDAYRLGVSVVHVHARDEQGRPTHKKEYFKEIFLGIKKKCPDIIICAITSGRVTSQVEHRSEVLDLNPEMASLTVGSMNFPHYPSVNSPETIRTLACMHIKKVFLPFLSYAKIKESIGALSFETMLSAALKVENSFEG